MDDIIIINLPNEVNVEETREFFNIFDFMIKKGFVKFIIDFTQVKFVSSCFLSAMLSSKKTLFSSNGNLVLANVSPKVYKILEITDLTSFFDILPSIEESIEYFSRKTK